MSGSIAMWTFPPAKSSRMDRHAEVAYESIAPVYDEFTAHHDYESWIAMLLELAAENGLRKGDTRGCSTSPAGPARASGRCSTAAGR